MSQINIEMAWSKFNSLIDLDEDEFETIHEIFCQCLAEAGLVLAVDGKQSHLLTIYQLDQAWDIFSSHTDFLEDECLRVHYFFVCSVCVSGLVL